MGDVPRLMLLGAAARQAVLLLPRSYMQQLQ
jgi:hypothetical protein